METRLWDDGRLFRRLGKVPFGIRTVEWGPENGLLPNGERVVLRGACVHHDNGILGAACRLSAAPVLI